MGLLERLKIKLYQHCLVVCIYILYKLFLTCSKFKATWQSNTLCQNDCCQLLLSLGNILKTDTCPFDWHQISLVQGSCWTLTTSTTWVCPPAALNPPCPQRKHHPAACQSRDHPLPVDSPERGLSLNQSLTNLLKTTGMLSEVFILS